MSQDWSEWSRHATPRHANPVPHTDVAGIMTSPNADVAGVRRVMLCGRTCATGTLRREARTFHLRVRNRPEDTLRPREDGHLCDKRTDRVPRFDS